jgi:hypothetical protein
VMLKCVFYFSDGHVFVLYRCAHWYFFSAFSFSDMDSEDAVFE